MSRLRILPLITVGVVMLGLLSAAPAVSGGPVVKLSGRVFTTMAGADKHAKKAPKDLKKFLVKNVKREAREAKATMGKAEYDDWVEACKEAGSAPVDAQLTGYHRKGFALGNYWSCVRMTGDGGVLRKKGGKWRVVVRSAQSVPFCSQLKKNRVPVALWKLAGGSCYDRDYNNVRYRR